MEQNISREELKKILTEIFSNSCILVKEGFTYQKGDTLGCQRQTKSSKYYHMMLNLSNISSIGGIDVEKLGEKTFEKQDKISMDSVERILNVIFSK